MVELDQQLSLPQFTDGGLVRETKYFRVVMGYKPGLEAQSNGQRFFVVPLTDDAQRMLELAAKVHNINNFNEKPVDIPDSQTVRRCLRADFIVDNLPSLMLGQVDIPPEGQDTIPSPDRMEQCLQSHPDKYSFTD